ncbi:hypothetical protein DNH61_25705 [Paenibacillus sambharensis]|uniref:N-acetyltransferase domain-containing protein n=1 Tax=Paenibacillus sambharensis TaxID=1803190 RepID=A0A2W1LCW3_9BACL|nr:GNAT family N-acetyltransferase [Paenibacillus sambharensis]PZD92895.1 hypothetical protein DNH61_25705 [Paenibacillus sambharensis]
MIRKPTGNESADCIKLMYMSGPEIFSYFFTVREPEVYSYINVFYTKPDVLFSSGNVWVKTENDKVCGLLLAVPAREMKQMDKNMMKYGKELSKTAGFSNTIRMMFRSGLQKYLTSVNHDDEYYISNLAVLEEYRGRGFGVELLHQAEELAREQGFNKLSLAVEFRNSAAIRIYEKFGFRQTDKVDFPRKYHKHSIDGFYKMVKVL